MRKFFALFLSATMIFSLTACKDKASEHQDSSIQATGEYIYVPEFYTLIPEESTSDSIGLGDIDSYVAVNALYDCPVTNVGYPGKGVLMSCEGIYISSKSKHKDICFSFIERTLSEESVLKFMNYSFPSNKAVFDKQIEERLNNPGGHTWGFGDGIVIKVPKPTKADADALKELIENASKRSTHDEAIFNILIEETAPYFVDQKSMDEVISIIQNRVKLYVNESR
ncbi:MAG: hypothetical protein ACI4EX_01515 [Lachnospiraceae bacterium]